MRLRVDMSWQTRRLSMTQNQSVKVLQVITSVSILDTSEC